MHYPTLPFRFHWAPLGGSWYIENVWLVPHEDGPPAHQSERMEANVCLFEQSDGLHLTGVRENAT